MASVKNYIHYHNNIDTLNKITEDTLNRLTDENLKRMIRECVEEIIGGYVEVAVNNIVNEKLGGFVKKEELEKYALVGHQHQYGELLNKPEIPNVENFATKEDLVSKVDKVEGMGLSQNNFTNEEREKLINLENYDDTELNKALNELSVAVKGIEGNQGEVNLEGLATIDYVNECLNEKKLVYLTEVEYEALSEEEKNKNGVVYNIIQE